MEHLKFIILVFIGPSDVLKLMGVLEDLTLVIEQADEQFCYQTQPMPDCTNIKYSTHILCSRKITPKLTISQSNRIIPKPSVMWIVNRMFRL
ncbi:hypothetical protein ACSYAD_32875, partial [Acaryochloris marina NIES-2412]|uniref:hypothetical protein n=1 Tax=Acaryochloris marina TaxID=155978 RepID=UPI00405892A6